MPDLTRQPRRLLATLKTRRRFRLLAAGAQNARGQQDREPKDCTHPSNAEGEDDDSAGAAAPSSAGGKASAPGQMKKNSQ